MITFKPQNMTCWHAIVLCGGLLLGNALWAQTPALLVTGADAPLERNIRAHVVLPRAACDASTSSLSRFLPQIRQSVTRASRALGYYFVREQVGFTTAEDCWELQIEVVPGDPVIVSAVDVEVRNNAQLFAELLAELPVAVGDQLSHAAYERIKSSLSSRAIEQGFFAARFENSQLLLDLQQNTVAIVVDFEPGERYQFGAVEIEPLEALSESFIRRYINFDRDAFYSSDALIDLRNSLNDSLYFSDVTVTPALERADNLQIPVQVGLQMRPRRGYTVGGGVTTDIGPRVRAEFEDRYLNTQGHKIKVESGASPIQQVVDANYVIPLQDPSTESLSFSGGFLREDNDTFKTNTFKLGSTYSFINSRNWRQSYFVNYQHDNYLINDDSEKTDLLIGGVNFTRTRADDVLYPRRGWRLFAQLRGASDKLLSSETFLQFNLNGKWVQGIGPGRALLKFETGTTLVNDIAQLPVSVQYFTGGDQSVRGYKYQSLGPLNDAGETIGGKHYLTAGIEYDFSVRPNWNLAVFVDAGNAFIDAGAFDPKKGAGIGVRWLSPIGAVRVDLASALDDDNKLRLHITMGPDL